MFGQFPQLFDRNFVIAFFLPALFLNVAGVLCIWQFGLLTSLPISGTLDVGDLIALVTFGSGLILVGSWLLGVVLLALNWLLYRMLEGYVPAWLRGSALVDRLLERQKERQGRLVDQFRALNSPDDPSDANYISRRTILASRIADEFPNSEHLFTVTAFGNVLAAWETYPMRMYGIDDQHGWYHMLAVIPKEYQQLIADEKAETDLWVNVFWTALVGVVVYAAFAIYYLTWPVLWLPLLLSVLMVSAYQRAIRSAIAWGYFVRAAYDLFLPELGKRLAFRPADRDEAARLWAGFNRGTAYKNKEDMPWFKERYLGKQEGAPQND